MMAREPVVAVPDAARAVFVAAARGRDDPSPAPRRGADRRRGRAARGRPRAVPRGRAVELFPAWETLPFERVSPALETMGRRLRVHVAAARRRRHLPAVVVAPVRALVQRLGPHVEDVEPIVVAPGRPASTATSSSSGSSRWATGASTRSRRAARSRCAGSIVDVYPSTADHPVRIDLWGDEVDRLSAFSVADQRSHRTTSPTRAIFPARELLPDRRGAGPRRASSCATRAVGPRAVGAARRGPDRSTAWSRGCRG